MALPPIPPVPAGQNNKTAEVDSDKQVGFGEMLKKAIDDVNTLQKQAEEAKVKLAAGEVDDLHSVMIAGEKAGLALQFTIQVRNKVIEAYQEVMRMQV